MESLPIDTGHPLLDEAERASGIVLLAGERARAENELRLILADMAALDLTGTGE